jgi:hypothetical protein
MANMGQFTGTSAGGTLFGVLPPGGTVTLSSITASGTMYVGLVAGTLLTSSNGFPVVTGQPPVVISNPVTAAPLPMYAISSGATGVLGYVFVGLS